MKQTSDIKVCSLCDRALAATAEFFRVDSRISSGLTARCKDCLKGYYAKYYLDNREKKIASVANYRKRNPEKIRQSNHEYAINNRDKTRLWSKTHWYRHHKENLRKKADYRNRNKGYISEYGRAYREKNKAHINKRVVEWNRAKRANDPMFRVRQNISRRINYQLRNGKDGNHVFHLLGYTSGELKKHIEAQFCGGMSWDNYGDWHIDHIIPVRDFAIQEVGDSEFLSCWSLANLRPLWATDNLSKSSKKTHLL